MEILDKTLEKMRRLLEMTDEETIQEIYESIEKVLPEELIIKGETEVEVNVGWAIGNELEPGNHCSWFVKVDNLKPGEDFYKLPPEELQKQECCPKDESHPDQ